MSFVMSSQSAIIFWNSSNDMLRSARRGASERRLAQATKDHPSSAGRPHTPVSQKEGRGGAGYSQSAAGGPHLPSFVFAYFPSTVLT